MLLIFDPVFYEDIADSTPEVDDPDDFFDPDANREMVQSKHYTNEFEGLFNIPEPKRSTFTNSEK